MNRHPVFQLRCAIDGISPPIWRRLAVRADLQLADLHRVLQVAFAWKDRHLHQFRVGHIVLGPLDVDPFAPPMLDEATSPLAALLPRPGLSLAYVYDFGDDWRHTITLQDVSLVEAAKPPKPRCEAGARAAPPEDCGGVPGYLDLLAALGDPGHPEHDHLRAWARGYDPEHFDAAALNRKLQRLPARRPRPHF